LSKEIDIPEIAKRYLLGELPEEERTALEERYFLDDEEFEQFEIAEDELIDQYVQNELSAEDTRRFEKLLVAPGLTERVEVARLIAQRTAAPVSQVAATPVPVTPKPETVGWWDRLFGSPAVAVPAFRPAFAMSLIFLMLATAAFIVVWMKLRTESQRLAQQQQQQEQLQRQIQEQKARFDELAAKLDKTEQDKEQQAALAAEYKRLLAEEQQQRAGTAMIFPIVLSPGGASRGSGGESVQAITIERGATQVGLKLNVTHGDDYTHYNAFVKNLDSSKPFTTRSNLHPFTQGGRKYITINVPAKDLPPGSYNVHLDGVTSDGRVDNFEDYPFRITAR
jgi:Tfp pilus assembly protein PilN